MGCSSVFLAIVFLFGGTYLAIAGVDKTKSTPKLRGQAQKQVQPTVPPSTDTDVVVSGTFVSVMAIGGETTGTAIKTEGGQRIEVNLTKNGFVREFKEGRQVKLTGRYSTVDGIERGGRQVFTVSHIE